MRLQNFYQLLLLSIGFCFLTTLSHVSAQGENMPPIEPWEQIERQERYKPDDGDFVITNGTRRFNRALYGDHSDFRVEAGDLPEFSSYLPGMGGNMQFALITNDQSKWLIHSDTVVARYRPGKMLYTIYDRLIDNGKINLEITPFAASDGYLVKVEASGIPEHVELLWVYGGVSGKRFTRNGDIGADPESVFYLHPKYCIGNSFYISDNQFNIYFGNDDPGTLGPLLKADDLDSEQLSGQRKLTGLVPPSMDLKLTDAGLLEKPEGVFQGSPAKAPVLTGKMPMHDGMSAFFALSMESDNPVENYAGISDSLDQAESVRKSLTSRIKVHTPDEYLNNLGEALTIAADAVYKDPVFLHGAVAWRNPLPGWRAAYIGDWLGWHDRARKHFDAYLKAQYKEPDTASAAPDPDYNLARQIEKTGYSIFTEGYISRNPGRISDPHHYDMNLVFFDQLLWHIQWSGDLEYARKIWPSVKRHLEWEKRSFDPNNDGLYDAYACIWSSDALQYSSGGVVYSSAYNYRGNKLASEIARAIGEDPTPFEEEAAKIHNAIHDNLWMPDKGWYAEYKDFLGLQNIHKYPGVWSIYHTIDSDVPDPFQAYQALRYIDTEIPKIPIEAKGFPSGYHTISTTSWMPYEWSVNNVALAEVLHTSLANWQGNRPQEAYHLWKSALLESMYLGASPGNFQQLSFYDAFRGELYRDFADAIGVASRTLVEGLFGIIPQALDNKLYLKPGFPQEWDEASLQTPDFDFDFQQEGQISVYTFSSELEQDLGLVFQPYARYDQVSSVVVNGKEVEWESSGDMVGQPRIKIKLPPEKKYNIKISWNGNAIQYGKTKDVTASEFFTIEDSDQEILDIFDPQNVLEEKHINAPNFQGKARSVTGTKTIFLKTKQHSMTWWEPVHLNIEDPVDVSLNREATGLRSSLALKNNADERNKINVVLNEHKNMYQRTITLAPNDVFEINIPDEHWIPGSNTLSVTGSNWQFDTTLIYWHQAAGDDINWQMADLTGQFNDKVTSIFRNDYISPRSPYPTLQIPVHGFGDWCSYNMQVNIDDSGLREVAGKDGQFRILQGIPFTTSGKPDQDNIIYTSLWDNYPDSIEVPLSGMASHAYLLMAGSTNHMQSRFTNGIVTISYTDGSQEELELVNPDTWWPIEQDYYIDGYAFQVETPRPPRVYLKTGKSTMEPYQVLSRNHTEKIDGGAATVLDIPLDPSRELQSLELKTSANEIVIGLMGITLMK